MTLQTPLIWDDVRGVSRQLELTEGLRSLGGLGVDGPLSFWGAQSLVGTQPLVSGDWAASLETLIDALVAYGLLGDDRAADWSTGLAQVAGFGRVGAYEPGRLVMGSTGGWMSLDQPPVEAGVIQALVAHSGAVETLPGGVTIRRLAYSPVSSYGATPPAAAPQAAALWFDSSVERHKIWNGTDWQALFPAALDALLESLGGLPANQLVVSDGADGLQVLPLPQTGRGGRIPMLDGGGGVSYVQLLSIGAAAPWGNGSSMYDPSPSGGGRSAGAEPALWFRNAPGSESLSVWDESAQQWKGVPLANPLLTRLAALQGDITEGDTFVVRGGQLDRLPIGTEGQSLSVRGDQAAWHSRFTAGAAAPAEPLAGDLWEDSSDALWLRKASGWRDLNQTPRFRSPNGFGGAALPGMAVVHDGAGWLLAGNTTARDAAVAIVAAPSAAGVAISAAIGGIVTLTAGEWSAVIDAAEPHAPGSGLLSGRMYYVSTLTDGLLTTQPALGQELPVGLALSNTRLQLRPAAPLSDRTAAAGVGLAAPAPRDGLLWWDRASKTLQVYDPAAEPGEVGSWEPAVPAGGGITPPPSSNPLVGLEAIDWLEDPLTAAIRFTLEDGTEEVLRVRGAGGTAVGMADNRTLVIDASASAAPLREIDGGRFSPLI